MKQFSVFVFLSFALAIYAIDCPENEIFDSCGTACEANCHYSPIICTEQCVAKCFCMEGFIRLIPDGKCVPTRECECSPNEDLKLDAPQCQNSCEPLPGICETAQFYPEYGCFCKEGFTRKTLKFSECIEKKNCLTKLF